MCLSRFQFCYIFQLLGKGSGLFRLERDSGRVFLNGSLNLEANDEKFYLRLRATDKSGHITESQLVIHVLKEQDTPPIVRGLAVIDGNFVTLGQDGKMDNLECFIFVQSCLQVVNEVEGILGEECLIDCQVTDYLFNFS